MFVDDEPELTMGYCALLELDGFELAEAATELRPELPVLLITGNALGLGPSGAKFRRILTKPFRTFELLDALAQVLDRA